MAEDDSQRGVRPKPRFRPCHLSRLSQGHSACAGLCLGGQEAPKDTLLNKDLACDLLCKTSAESGLIVGNLSGTSDRSREAVFSPRRWCHSLTREVSSVSSTTPGLIREEKSQKVTHRLASPKQAVRAAWKPSAWLPAVASCRRFIPRPEHRVCRAPLCGSGSPRRRDLWF